MVTEPSRTHSSRANPAADPRWENLESANQEYIPSYNVWTLKREPCDLPQRLRMYNLAHVRAYWLTSYIFKSRIYAPSAGLNTIPSLRPPAAWRWTWLLVPCRLQIAKNHSAEARHAAPQTPLPLMIFPELSVGVDLIDLETTLPVRVTGRADWGIGFGERRRTGEGTVMGMIEVKRREAFSSAEPQLLAYLAILRQRRIQHGKRTQPYKDLSPTGNATCIFMAICNTVSIRMLNTYTADLPYF